MKKSIIKLLIEIFAVLIVLVLFGIPFYYIFINSGKTAGEAADISMKLPKTPLFFQNYLTVLKANNGMVIRAFFNSIILTVTSIIILVIVCSTAGFIIQRRRSKTINFISLLILTGLMIPPAVVPTIWVLRGVGLFKTLLGLILVEVAISIPFTTLLYRGYMATISREIDEAAIIDGCNTWQLFYRIIFPLLQPVTATVIILSAIIIFNDFTHPLYFLPGAKNITVQLTLYNFMSMYNTQWNLLFADVVIISLPPLIMFILFNNRIIGGMTAGAIKG